MSDGFGDRGLCGVQAPQLTRRAAWLLLAANSAGTMGCNAIFGIEDSIRARDASIDGVTATDNLEPRQSNGPMAAESGAPTGALDGGGGPDVVQPLDGGAHLDSGSASKGGSPADSSAGSAASTTQSAPSDDSTVADAAAATPMPCGNGVLEGEERCDDGNTADQDGCNSNCRVEEGWDCGQSEPTKCTPACGDGLLLGAEAREGGCDDDNFDSGDGCSSKCEVEPGYRCALGANASVCSDIDECAEEADNCDAHATCTNTEGSFSCACREGYDGDGRTCTNIDECATGSAKCEAHATCRDTDGSFECTCNNGFDGDGRTCTNIDECATGTDNCDTHATCGDTDGSFECTCIEGYDGDGPTCTNIDECAAGTDNCDTHATCSDTDGSFECTCNEGYLGDGTSCVRTSCQNLASNCGVNQNDNCCASGVVTGGNFEFRSTVPATIATFALDRYEVTVGRFRQFVAAYAGPPAAGAGAHPLIANSGWDATWNSQMPSTASELIDNVTCSSTYETWDSSGANDRLPMNCVDWYEAFAFCAWDGGRLPTDAEWEYAAAGAAEQREYPWGSAAPTSSLAVYDCLGDGSAADDCSFEDILAVGSKPAGSGKYGQLDLAGSMWEWSLDWYSAALPGSCNNCANVSSGSLRGFRGGSWGNRASSLRAVNRDDNTPTFHSLYIGLRCARIP